MRTTFQLDVAINHPDDTYGMTMNKATRGGTIDLGDFEVFDEGAIQHTLFLVREHFDNALEQVELALRARSAELAVAKRKAEADKDERERARAARL